MIFRHHLSILLLLVLFVHHSFGQNNDISYSGLIPTNNANVDSTSNTGLQGTIRNTTNNILQRLEGPRDRVIDFIKPAVKSDFSRNVTNVLNSIWSRVQESNSSIIQHPLFKNSIVIPINTTLARLKQITADENEDAEVEGSNLEVINLNRPEDEANLKDYLQAPSNAEEAAANPRVIFLVKDEDEQANQPAASEESSEQILPDSQPIGQPNEQPANQPIDQDDEVRNNDLKDENVVNQSVDKPIETPQLTNSVVRANDDTLNPTKSIKKRQARFLDSHYTIVTPSRVNHLFNNVQRSGMQQCMALALCEANCRPDLYNEGRPGTFRRLFDRVESFGSDHSDFGYYADARRFGQQFYDGEMDECRSCHARYYCPHDRDTLMDRFTQLGNFNN